MQADRQRNFRSSSIALSYTSLSMKSSSASQDKEETAAHSFFSPLRKGSDINLDSGSDAESQDSGFSGSFSEKSCTDSLTPSAGPSVRSRMFMDEDAEDGFMHLFDLDSMDENSSDAKVPSVLTNLFTKPICKIVPKEEDEFLNSVPKPVHHVKKTARRRLSMTSDDSPLSIAMSVSKPPLYSLLKRRMPSRRKSEASIIGTDLSTCCKSGDCLSGVENCSKYANSISTISNSPAKSPFKRPEPPENKRQRRSPLTPLSYSMKLQLNSTKRPVLQRSFSESEASIIKALQKSDEQPDLIGDFSKPYILPLINGKHQDMKTVSPHTLAQLMKGVYSNSIVSYKVVDCRYPYEFEGGHIQGALNIYTTEGILSSLLSQVPQSHYQDQRSIIIFHCEFSSKRAPDLCRFLRNQDRECNKDSYPHLCHPEVYLLEGGYKAFFESYKELCEPQEYTPMLHKDYEVEYRHFRAKSKSWSGGQPKKRANVRMGKKFQVV